MLISKKWLSEFVEFPRQLSDFELANMITLSTVEVEQVIDQAATWKWVVVGVIKSVKPHSNADKLKVCEVNVGREGGSRIVQIVCGGTNVSAGMKVAVALPGAQVKWHGEGEFVELAKTKIRGEESEGMICASAEIGLRQTEGDHEILDLGQMEASAGTPLAQALGMDDVIFDIEHKSLTNRPDLMGHYGMAREVAVLTKSRLVPYRPKPIASDKGIDLMVEVEERADCPRYMAVAMTGIVVGESPDWVKRRLETCGIRSINNVVDVTNYVMLELGQPMHAFDADILGEKIVVRHAKPKERLTALDEKTYQLDPEMLVIGNGEKAVAIAGVMGGEGSGVSEKTTRIVFESANFSPVSVRKTSMKLGVRSESSARFEKSLDPQWCELALRRAVELMMEVCPGARVASHVVDVYPRKAKPVSIRLTPTIVNERLGGDIPVANMADILIRLGFSLKLLPSSKPSKPFTVTVPSWRATKDISIAEDVVEEIARVWGYKNIESALPSFSINPPEQDPIRRLMECVRNTLAVGLGATETYRYAFLAPEQLRTLGFDETPGFHVEDHLKLVNPLADDRPYLCQSLVPNLFDTIVLNHRSFQVVNVFEIARVFFGAAKGEEDGQGGTLPAQPYHLGIAYSAQDDESPLVELRHQVDTVLTQAGFQVSFREMEDPVGWMHPARAADILVEGKKYGILAEALPDVAAKLGIDRRLAIAEMNLTMLAAVSPKAAAFSPIPAYPDAKRDLAFTVAEKTPAVRIEEAAREASKLLQSYELFDVYRGKGIKQGQKSMAVHLTFRSPKKTLESKEVDEEIEKIRHVLEKEFDATMRS